VKREVKDENEDLNAAALTRKKLDEYSKEETKKKIDHSIPFPT